MTGAIYQLKDPQAKGDVSYQIPASEVEPTVGMKGKNFKGCLCRLHLEKACRQGKKCKSYHVNVAFIKKMRELHNVVLDTDFLTEVVVCTVVDSSLLVFAVRYPAVFRTKGLIEYRKTHARGQKIYPHRLCDDFRRGNCPLAGNCRSIHVKPTEIKGLNPKRLRTPCCATHGDVHSGQPLKLNLQLDSGKQMPLPVDCVAENEALLKVSRDRTVATFTVRELCMPHITGRCKYGKSCGNLHVCRSWWRQNEQAVTEPAAASNDSSMWEGIEIAAKQCNERKPDELSWSSGVSIETGRSPLPSPDAPDFDDAELSLPVWDCTGFKDEIMESPLYQLDIESAATGAGLQQ
eukprot:TRINITY_DN1218_c0_g2_i6.p1 TRINITY_DN1218_c0_g2~~TRINITY_DN1218_c0_g2_i6.p1  ORF type:complete len:348 (+),score=60.57 TRINITY_DN1218_c0_g2_i6:66-1109(+)